MKLAIATAAGLAMAATANAQSLDLSGVGVEGTTPVMVGSISSMTAVTAIEFDNLVSVDTSPSWGSEVQIQIDGPNGFSFSAGGGDVAADLTFGWGNSSGTWTFTGSAAVSGDAGTYNVSVFQSFDDFSPDPDSVFQSGTITLIPTPGSAAILGLGGLAAVRRRR